MLADLGVCPSLAKDGAPRCALESSCRRIPVSAHLAGVGLLLAFLSTLGCLVRAPGVGMNMAEGDTLISVDYEIFGKVQGVFFRKYTQAEGKKLGLVGWVQNTDEGTVQGQLQGPVSKVRHMQEWLETRGSPKSHIDRANFRNEKVIVKLDYSDFQIVK
ncbi:acylphosphatase-1 isoform X1 [Halichoerus grypus]|uniref:acylphosphatase-1 isoform X1 n=2 Tax=Phoca vitulina TaxID=9720 RepID=UPI001395D511|nr:acylphosphatase-1 isoform X1 [Phoca vitulina]XP_035928686.1 acylphosphatase-1 isoform X1 [Halichoerus grypus]